MSPNSNHLLDIDPDLNYYPAENMNENLNYYTVDEYSSVISEEINLLKIMSVNIRSLAKNGIELKVLLETISNKPDLLVVTETWLIESDLNEVYVEGFSAFHSTRPTGRGGGVSLFYRESLECIKCDAISCVDESIEICSVRVKLSKCFHILAIYRPHSGSIAAFTDSLEIILNNSEIHNSNICLMGDFNANILNENCVQSSNLTQLLSSYHFVSLINSPTRFSSISNPSLLDQCWLNSFDYKSSGVILYNLTDHCPIFANLDFRSPVTTNPIKTVRFRLVDEMSFQNFVIKLCDIP